MLKLETTCLSILSFPKSFCITKYHVFNLESSNYGVVKVKELAMSTEETVVPFLKPGVAIENVRVESTILL